MGDEGSDSIPLRVSHLRRWILGGFQPIKGLSYQAEQMPTFVLQYGKTSADVAKVEFLRTLGDIANCLSSKRVWEESQRRRNIWFLPLGVKVGTLRKTKRLPSIG